MHDRHSPRRIPLSVVAGLSVLIVATGSAVAWWSWTSASRNTPVPTAVKQPDASQNSQSPPTNATADQKPQTRMAPATTEKTLQVYWLKGSGAEIALAPAIVKLSSVNESNLGLKVALEQLLAGPTDASVATTIPKNTRLLSMAVREDGVYVNLSKEFTTGGGSASMTARVAQILYTSTSLNPDAQVWLLIDGKSLETLGGEGLILNQPLTRKTFERDFSL